MRGIPGIGERIDQRRVTLGWRSLTDFALDTHHSPQVVHAWVRRGQIPKWAMLERLAVELRCPLAWLLLGEQVFEAVPSLRAFYEELYGKPLHEKPIDPLKDPPRGGKAYYDELYGRLPNLPPDPLGGGNPERPIREILALGGLDDDKAHRRFRF